jgi:inhibitor of cysteine peptidase
MMFRKMFTCWVLAGALGSLPTALAGESPADSKTIIKLEVGPSKAEKAEPGRAKTPAIDTKKPGSYAAGLWKYEVEFLKSDSRLQARVGRLAYAGRQAVQAQVNDFHNTPWGPIYWVGNPKGPGDHGWMPRAVEGIDRKGKLLPLPGSGPSRLELTEADNGGTVKAIAGAKIFIRLRGNPTTGYRWQLADKPGDAVEQTGKVEYTPDPQKPAAVGAGGTYTVALRAVQPGAATVKLAYLRTWEKDKAPAQTMSVTVEVSQAPERGMEK